ncbi:MAG TPA: putative O-glycosylation ligase, exosortase A system-associated [Steroidobacteraceae bacterium]|nr:putative O-glycosylation ligase, exosortase A system-associated [Steroidobacteraceae bacterium]
MRDVVVLLGVICLLPAALARPWIGFLGFTLIGLWNPHKFTWYLKDMRIALLVAAATLIGLVITRERKGIAWSRELVLMLVFAIYFTVTTQFAWAPEAAAAQLGQNIRVYFMIFVMGMLIYGEKKIRAMLLVIMLGIGLFGVKGGIFSILTGGQYHVVGPETTFLEANTSLGLAFNMILPLLLVTAQEQAVRWRALGFYGSAFLTFLATIFTYSRGAWIGLAATVPFLLLRIKHGVLIGVLMIPVGLVGIAFIPDKVFNRAETIGSYEEDNSAMTRIQAWSVAYNVAKENPLVGGGFDYENYPDPQRWLSHADRKYDAVDQTPRAAHSIYFQVLGQHGFVGFGIFMTLLGLTMFSFSGIARDVRNIPDLGWIGRYAKAMQVGMIGYMVSGAFLNLAYFDLLYLYIGLVAIFRREIREYHVAHPAIAGASNLSMVGSLLKKPVSQGG